MSTDVTLFLPRQKEEIMADRKVKKLIEGIDSYFKA
jgi:hypothetical protein